jgi:hypothetical protein
VTEYGISDDGGLLTLQVTLEAFDRQRDCTERIAAEGATVLDRFDKPKPHPLLAAERDARGQVLHGIKLLGLDIVPGETTQCRNDVPSERLASNSIPNVRRVV